MHFITVPAFIRQKQGNFKDFSLNQTGAFPLFTVDFQSTEI